ncbi:MAG: LCP family protein [bacterium]|nr:LCP family protein [bacterium]
MREYFGNMLSRLKERKLGMVFLTLQLIASVAIVILVERLHMLKPVFLGAIIGGVAVLFLLMVIGNGAKSKFHICAKVISALLIIVYGFGAYYLYVARDAAGKVTDVNIQTEKVSIYVLKTNEAETINDVVDGTFAVFNVSGSSNKIDETIASVNAHVNKEIATKEFSDAVSAAKALYEKEVDAIIMDESYVQMIEDNKTYKDFETETKVLESYEHKTTLQNLNAVSDVTEKPFSVFISGIDTFGDVNKKSRSDVNMTATINPKTKQILLTSTPRDYYVETTVSNGQKDKLTHAGLYGIECSIGTLEKLYNMQINYNVRVNFSGFEDIVDALGGITVHSDYDFTSDQGPAFVKGDNEMNGKQALAFARERHAFAAGDIQRNKDQQYVMQGIINKVCSPTILTNFASILKSIEGNMSTNLKYDDIAAFVQMQINDGASWDVIMIGLDGEGKKLTTYSAPSQSAYVMLPNETKVSNATALINKVLNGEVFTQEQAKEVMKSSTVIDATTPLATTEPSASPATEPTASPKN